ncbi:MAG: 6-carboxytetrahydropterin synthase [Candidatus Poribacteria bacterium]|nr:6-carboxytetrahydropterin synthase [Candidatus Poribacteria bacterium]
MYTTVIVPFEFYASHSLSIREKPHNHYWALKLFVRGVPKNGMVIDILKLRALTDPYVEKLADTYLNENPDLTEEQAACPTCEMLAAYFYAHVSEALEEFDAELKAVEVELRELEGKEWGAARLEAD